MGGPAMLGAAGAHPGDRRGHGVEDMNTQLLDGFPNALILVAFAIITLGCYEVGFRVGRWWQDRMPGEQEGPTEMLVGSLLALMAFLLAVTMGMASDRFDARRGLVLEEANAIGTAYLQADYLPEAAAAEMKSLMRDYLDLRIVDADSDIPADLARSRELHAEMWAIAAEVARSGHSPDLVSAFGDSLTTVIAINESRLVSGMYARVPETVLLILLAGSALSLGMVGYTAGLKRRRSVLSAVVMTLILGVVLIIVIDLDRPRDGVITVSQQALIDTQQWVGPPDP
jgi:hypothetical protein